jgi:2-methylcitrate dehydratase
VPGTSYQLDPVQAAFNIGTIIRWLDFNDTWLAAEWGHPSDNLGAILAVADWLSAAIANGQAAAHHARRAHRMIKAHEIQGCIALENSFNKVGLDHVVLVKVASTAVVSQMLGLTREQTINAVSLAWVDGQACAPIATRPTPARAKAGPPATPPAAPCASRSWPAAGEMGYPTALTAKTWGFYDVPSAASPSNSSAPTAAT